MAAQGRLPLDVGFDEHRDYDMGEMASIGVTAGMINSNWSFGKVLTLETSNGWSEGFSGGTGPLNTQYVVGYVDSDWQLYFIVPTLKWLKKCIC